MREFKFRVWHKPDKTMHPYLKVKFGKSVNVTFDGKFKDVDQITTKTVPKKDIEIMQFTGLKDKNGKEIYEGDLLLNPMAGAVWEVKFRAAMFIAALLPKSGEVDFAQTKTPLPWEQLKLVHENFEVIGNIYEDEERLKPTNE